MNLPASKKYNLSLFLSIDENMPGYPFGHYVDDLIHYYNPVGLSKKELLEYINAFTIYPLEAFTTKLQLKSGHSVDEWIKANGRDVRISYEVDFSPNEIKFPERNFACYGGPEDDGKSTCELSTFGFEQGYIDFQNVYKFRARQIVVMGAYEKNPPVRVRAEIYGDSVENGGVLASIDEQLNYQDIRENLLFRLDDSSLKELTSERNILGDLDLSIEYGYGFSENYASWYARLNLFCENGKIKGTITQRESQFYSEDDVLFRGRVYGTCDGEANNFSMEFMRADSSIVTLTFGSTRIAARYWPSSNGKREFNKLLMTKNFSSDRHAKFIGADQTMNLPLFDGQQEIGTISVMTPKGR
ncbi:MAG: hypothetical protein M9962_01105 [Oligoflexia bacterium]|nr:hypothetical protein [Oligoflexia bacterium]